MTSDKYMRPSAVRTLHQGKERTVDKEVHTGKKNIRHAGLSYLICGEVKHGKCPFSFPVTGCGYINSYINRKRPQPASGDTQKISC